jgi:CRP-like cAMP-binding protein
MRELLEPFRDKLLTGLAEDEVSAFSRLCRTASYPAGSILFGEGSEARTLYLLADGAVDLIFAMPGGERTGTTVTIDERGETIGWSALVPPHAYRSAGSCRTAVVVLEVDRDALVPILETNTHMGYILMRNVAALVGRRLLQVERELIKCVGDEIIHGW